LVFGFLSEIPQDAQEGGIKKKMFLHNRDLVAVLFKFVEHANAVFV
jgi:hypothetical protein